MPTSNVTIISKLKLVCFALLSSSGRQQTIVASPPKITTSAGPYRRRPPLPPILFSDALLTRKSHSKTKLVFLPNITGQAPIVELPSVLFMLRSSEPSWISHSKSQPHQTPAIDSSQETLLQNQAGISHSVSEPQWAPIGQWPAL